MVEPFGTVTFILKGAANLYLSTETAYSFPNLVQLTRSLNNPKPQLLHISEVLILLFI